jgi:hypothetical protein
MTQRLVSILVVAGLLAAAMALNPSADKHRSRIKESIAERSQVEKVLEMGSYTTVNGKVASVGAFGLVLTPD